MGSEKTGVFPGGGQQVSSGPVRRKEAPCGETAPLGPCSPHPDRDRTITPGKAAEDRRVHLPRWAEGGPAPPQGPGRWPLTPGRSPRKGVRRTTE